MLGQQQTLQPFDDVLDRERLHVRAISPVPIALQVPKNFCQQKASIHSQGHLPRRYARVHSDEGMKGLVL